MFILCQLLLSFSIYPYTLLHVANLYEVISLLQLSNDCRSMWTLALWVRDWHAHLTFTAVLWLRKNYLFAMFLKYKCSKLLTNCEFNANIDIKFAYRQ